METSLHRQLKRLYAGAESRQEVRVGRWRIDAVVRGRLVEVQLGSLAAIRGKVQALLSEHRLLVVKPIVVGKQLIKLDGRGRVVSERPSPKRGTLLDAFDELVYFTQVFPHPNLTLELPLVEIVERRSPGHGRRRRWRQDDFVVEDQELVAIAGQRRLRTTADLVRLLPARPTGEFDTAELAQALGVRRFVAQRIAYCLRTMGAVATRGKRGRAWLYCWTDGADGRQAA